MLMYAEYKNISTIHALQPPTLLLLLRLLKLFTRQLRRVVTNNCTYIKSTRNSHVGVLICRRYNIRKKYGTLSLHSYTRISWTVSFGQIRKEDIYIRVSLGTFVVGELNEYRKKRKD